jgi:hypothetical protein
MIFMLSAKIFRLLRGRTGDVPYDRYENSKNESMRFKTGAQCMSLAQVLAIYRVGDDL